MTEIEFKQRTKRLALEVIRFSDALPRSRSADVLPGQLLRSATSVAANYRAACRAKSIADMIAKLSIVEEEADESGLWMELLAESGKTKAETVAVLRREAEEILAMTVASIKTLSAKLAANLKSKISNPKSSPPVRETHSLQNANPR